MIGDGHSLLYAGKISKKAWRWGGNTMIKARNLRNGVMNIIIVNIKIDRTRPHRSHLDPTPCTVKMIARPDGMSIEEAWEIYNQTVGQMK